MKKYQEPQAHHWIVLRLLRQLLKSQGGHGRNAGLSTVWLIREVGIKRVMSMIEQLEQEEA
jgi:hypothetical protein